MQGDELRFLRTEMGQAPDELASMLLCRSPDHRPLGTGRIPNRRMRGKSDPSPCRGKVADSIRGEGGTSLPRRIAERTIIGERSIDPAGTPDAKRRPHCQAQDDRDQDRRRRIQIARRLSDRMGFSKRATSGQDGQCRNSRRPMRGRLKRSDPHPAKFRAGVPARQTCLGGAVRNRVRLSCPGAKRPSAVAPLELCRFGKRMFVPHLARETGCVSGVAAPDHGNQAQLRASCIR